MSSHTERIARRGTMVPNHAFMCVIGEDEDDGAAMDDRAPTPQPARKQLERKGSIYNGFGDAEAEA